MKLPLITGNDLCRIVSKLGFIMVHQKGSHTVWKHSDGRSTTIPVHPGKKLPRGLIRKILTDIEISHNEYLRLRK